MAGLPRCIIPDSIGREAGVASRCYPLKGNQPARLRRGDVFTVDTSIRLCDGALSNLSIPYEPLLPGPAGTLFEVDATDCVTSVSRGRPDLDRRGPDDFAFDQGQNETHCRNVYFTAMATYESFRRALGRPVAWAFWREGSYPPLRLMPFAQQALNAYYDRSEAAIGFGYSPAGGDSDLADRRLIRFTALSSDIVAHEVTHALIDGLRPDYDMPVHPDVFAFHEALADVVALLSRFERPGYLAYLLRESGMTFLQGRSLISLAPELGRLVRESGLRSLDVDWTSAGTDQPGKDLPRYADAPDAPHARGGLLSSAVFEAFLGALDRRIGPLIQLAAPTGSSVGRYLLEQVQEIAARTAEHFLAICVRALDYCPPAAILFSDYLRAMITADRLLAPRDRHGYREQLIDAFRRRGIYPEGIDVVSEGELAWKPPEVPVYPIPGLALSELRYDISPILPLSAAEIRRQARALALAIDADPRLARELGLRDPGLAGPGMQFSAPEITSVRPTLRVGPEGFIDFSIIAEVTQNCDIRIDDQSVVRHRGGATLILDPRGTPALIVRQRIDNTARLTAETEYVRKAIAERRMMVEDGRYVPDRAQRRGLCAGH
ncbi:hypothetical protein [Paracoccus marinaquae]|uniref:Peptidase M4 n=1 Tax=Paracoccus marinaquae TaxID=2841926 RepID=A0ABS6AKS8_9RHOB|nr:hypothetical protein [Paracoccus marinaquae]MBU3031099.1 hypothetical protein [Paracoccus marinaquae]